MFRKRLTGFLDRYPKVAYIHVPKCAGISAVDSLYRAVFPRVLKATRSYRRINLRSSQVAEALLGVDMMKCREVVLINCLGDPYARFVAGHVHAHPETVRTFGDWKFVTLLREPRQRFLSHYVYNRFKGSDWLPLTDEFPDYVRTERARRSAAAFALYFSGMELREIERDPDAAVEASIANLRRFASVGFLDSLEGWKGDIERLFGRRPEMPHVNRSPRPDYETVQGSTELSAIVDELCSTDRRIYDAARTLLRAGSTSLRPSGRSPTASLEAAAV